MKKYELTADMTENRHYWKMLVKTGPQLGHKDVDMVSKSTPKVRHVSKYISSYPSYHDSYVVMNALQN